MKNKSTGFALLIAVIFMSVMLAIGAALTSMAYKQIMLTGSAVDSQHAFYAADAGLECALYADQQQRRFAYPATAPPSAPTMTCDNVGAVAASIREYTATQWVVINRVSVGAGARCAEVTIYKPASGTTYLFSEGFSVPCTSIGAPGVRFSVRGIKARY